MTVGTLKALWTDATQESSVRSVMHKESTVFDFFLFEGIYSSTVKIGIEVLCICENKIV
jgi:hypothetical protein